MCTIRDGANIQAGFMVWVAMCWLGLLRCDATTLEEIRRASLDAKEQINAFSCLSAVYVLDRRDPRMSIADESRLPVDAMMDVYTANLSTSERITGFLDCSTTNGRSSSVDLRNIALVAASNNVPSSRTNMMATSQTWLGNGFVLLNVRCPWIGTGGTDNTHVQINRSAYLPLSECRYFGVLDADHLTAMSNAVVTNVAFEGKEMVEITSSELKNGHIVQESIICDPSVGYRYVLVKVCEDDTNVILEMVADDYRMTESGIPFPYRFTSHQHNSATWQDYTFEAVQYLAVLPAETFRVHLPSQALVDDPSITHKGWRIPDDVNWTADDLIQYLTEQQANAALVNHL